MQPDTCQRREDKNLTHSSKKVLARLLRASVSTLLASVWTSQGSWSCCGWRLSAHCPPCSRFSLSKGGLSGALSCLPPSARFPWLHKCVVLLIFMQKEGAACRGLKLVLGMWLHYSAWLGTKFPYLFNKNSESDFSMELLWELENVCQVLSTVPGTAQVLNKYFYLGMYYTKKYPITFSLIFRGLVL